MRSAVVSVVAVGLGIAIAGCGLDDKDDPPGDAIPPEPDAIRPIDARPVIDGNQIDAPPAGNPGFPRPTSTTKANVFQGGAWTEVGDADWSCLGAPSTDQPSTQALTLSGRVADFQNDNGVGGATITAFPGTATATPLGSATSDSVAATRGNFTMVLGQLPAGQTRYGFRIEAPQYMRTYVLNQFFPPAMASHSRELAAMSTATANAIVAFIGVQFDPMTGTVVGSLRDCQGRAVSNAVATVSSASGVVAHLPGASTFYFSAASSSLPVRRNVAPVMNKDGLFMVIDLAPQAAPAFVQIWGFRTGAELMAGTLTLLGELRAPIEASAITTVDIEPRRS